jgi:hypothetical protein
MDPIFTLQWSEFVLAERLQEDLPKKHGYSVWIPLSRQEKGVDLAVLKRRGDGMTKTVTLQVKASRTYRTAEPKREATQRYSFHTWFNRFDVPDEADFILLFGQYAPDVARTRNISPQWYKDMTLLFTKHEMKELISNCRTVGGKEDRMFGFGFDDDSKIVQVRGDAGREQRDFTAYLLTNRLDLLRNALDA